jgi:hypothetical protein
MLKILNNTSMDEIVKKEMAVLGRERVDRRRSLKMLRHRCLLELFDKEAETRVNNMIMPLQATGTRQLYKRLHGYGIVSMAGHRKNRVTSYD